MNITVNKKLIPRVDVSIYQHIYYFYADKMYISIYNIGSFKYLIPLNEN